MYGFVCVVAVIALVNVVCGYLTFCFVVCACFLYLWLRACGLLRFASFDLLRIVINYVFLIVAVRSWIVVVWMICLWIVVVVCCV